MEGSTIFSKLPFICGILFITSVLADTITIYNKSKRTVYVAPYYKRGALVQRCGDVLAIEPGTSVQCARPTYKDDVHNVVKEYYEAKFWYDRKLFLTTRSERLKDKLLRADRKKLSSQKIGWIQGYTFYVAEIDFRLKGFNSFGWNIVQPVLEAGECLVDTIVHEMRDNLRKLLPVVRYNNYKKMVATVRQGNQLCSQEYAYRAARKVKVKRMLEKLLGFTISDNIVPTIAVVISGGGFRAMIATIGFLCGLERLGLLYMVTYISTLSGSTWAVGSWFASGMPISLFKVHLLSHLAPGLLPLSFRETRLIVDMILSKWCFDQPVTEIDFYGALVGNRILKEFGKKRHRIYLSDQLELLKYGEWPMPIYTAVRTDPHTNFEWYEFTPYEIGGAWLGHYVPSWAYGRKFEQGKSIDFAPEQSLSSHFGVFGSAFAATFNRMYQEVADNISSDPVKVVIERVLEDIGNQRLANSCFHNFTYSMKLSPIGTKKYIELADAGLDFNLPYPPISGERPERKADVIIFLDVSYTIEGVPALKGVASYAQMHNLVFPTLDAKDIDKKVITVLNNEHNNVSPVVVYMPWVKDEELWKQRRSETQFRLFRQYLNHFDPRECLNSFCDTFNFEYTQRQAEQVCSLAEFNVLASKETLLSVIEQHLKME